MNTSLVLVSFFKLSKKSLVILKISLHQWMWDRVKSCFPGKAEKWVTRSLTHLLSWLYQMPPSLLRFEQWWEKSYLSVEDPVGLEHPHPTNPGNGQVKVSLGCTGFHFGKEYIPWESIYDICMASTISEHDEILFKKGEQTAVFPLGIWGFKKKKIPFFFPDQDLRDWYRQ